MSTHDEIIEAVSDYGARLGIAAASFILSEEATYETSQHLFADNKWRPTSAPPFGEWPGSELILGAYVDAGIEESEFSDAYDSNYVVALEDTVQRTAERIAFAKFVQQNFGDDADPDDYMHLLDEDEDEADD